MSDTGQKDRCVLEAIRQGDGQAWSRLVDEYQGRLLRFATARVSQRADAEDAVQETFASFIKALDHLQIEATLETYLFSILRNEIVNRFRTRWARTVCLIQDVCGTAAGGTYNNALAQIPASDPSVSWYVSRNEQHQLQRHALTEALRRMVGRLQDKAKFRDLKIAELVFYCQMPNRTVAKLLSVDERIIRVTKHRGLKRIREDVLKRYPAADISLPFSEDLLTEVWEQQRLSCPGRDTLDAFLRETLSAAWFDYVDFHLTTLGCHFCRASFKDLQEQQSSEQHTRLRERIVTSTAGFLSAG